MSAKGLFIRGFTRSDVKRILARAKELLMEGKTVMSWNDGGTSVSKQFTMPIPDVLEECAYALRYFERQKNGSSSDTSGSSDTSRVAYRFPL